MVGKVHAFGVHHGRASLPKLWLARQRGFAAMFDYDDRFIDTDAVAAEGAPQERLSLHWTEIIEPGTRRRIRSPPPGRR